VHNKCLGVFLIFLAFPFVVLSILELSFFRDFTRSQFYKTILKQSNSYQGTSNLIGKNEVPSQTNIVSMLSQSINAQWLQANTEQNLDNFFAFLNGKTSQANLSINLSSLKANLKPTTDVPQDVINLIPNQLSIDSYQTFLTNLEQEIKKQSAGDAISTQMAQQDISNIQNQIQNTNNISGQYQNNLNNIKRGFFLSKIVGFAILAVTLLLLLFIGLAARTDISAVTRWIGNALVYPAGLMVVFFYILGRGSPLCIKAINNLNASADIKNILRGIGSSAIQNISLDGMKIAGAFFIGGLILIIISYLIPIFHKKSAPLGQTPQNVLK
jgi:hypothetical protein